MRITFKLSPVMAESLSRYIVQLMDVFNTKSLHASVNHHALGRYRADYTELLVLKQMVGKLLDAFDKSNSQKRTLKITYTQGFILWSNYDLKIHPIVLNELLSHASKPLTINA